MSHPFSGLRSSVHLVLSVKITMSALSDNEAQWRQSDFEGELARATDILSRLQTIANEVTDPVKLQQLHSRTASELVFLRTMVQPINTQMEKLVAQTEAVKRSMQELAELEAKFERLAEQLRFEVEAA